MPLVLLPAAEPQNDAAVAAPPALTTSPEYVYLFRVTTPVPLALPSAKMPKTPSLVAVMLLLNALNGDGP